MPNYKEDVQEAITFRVYNTDGTPYTTVGTPPTLFIQKNKTGTPIGVSGGTLTHHGSGLWGYIPGASEVSNPCKSVHLMWAATGVTPGDVCIDFENQFTPTVATRITDQRRPIMAYGGVVYSSASRAHSVYLTDLAGAPKTGLVFNSGISVYWRDQYGNATQVVLVTQTVTGAYATGGFVEISSANMPGWYRLDLPNALYGGGSTYAVLSINHSTITPYQCYFDIVGYQPYQANLGITDITTAKTNTDTLIARLGVFTGTGVNTVLGFLKAMTSKTATLPSDIGGTFDVTTDSSEAIRDRGDVAWGSAGGLTQGDVRTAVGLGSANLDTQLSGINAKTTNLPTDPADASDIATQFGVVNTATTLTNSRLGAITGSGNNTLLGFFKGLLSKVAPVPSDIGGTFDSTTDSIEAIRDRGDVAWTTGAGGGGGSVNTSIILNATDALLSAGITPLEIVGASGKIINVQILSGGPVYFANSSGVISAVTVPAKEISKEDKIVKLNFADRAWYFTLSGTARFTYTIEN